MVHSWAKSFGGVGNLKSKKKIYLFIFLVKNKVVYK